MITFVALFLEKLPKKCKKPNLLKIKYELKQLYAVLPKRSAKWALGPQCGLFQNSGPHLVRIGAKKWAISPPCS